MKTFYKIFAFSLISLLWSCELTLIPEDSVTPEVFFKTETELDLWTNQFYTIFDSADGAAGQNADDNVDRALGDVISGTRSAADESGWSWSRLRRINYFLEYSSNCENDQVREHYEGVAYFFRAYFYFNMVRRYGDVPWYDQVIDSDNQELLFKPRDDRGFVMDKVLEDLDRAIAMLPASRYVSKVTRWTALAFKTRAALYEGTFRKYHGMDNADKYLQQVVEAGAEFINNSGYSLYNSGNQPYRDLFNSNNAKSEEVILARLYNFEDLSLSHGIQFNITNMQQGFTRRFMNHYLMADGSRFTDVQGYETMFYTQETQNRDPRLSQTVLSPGYIQTGETTVSPNSLLAMTGYQPIKFVGDASHDGASKGTSDWPLFRTAEVYLNYAEAKAELGTITQSDLDNSVNKIRQRAKMPAISLDQANAQPDPFLVNAYPNVTKNQNKGIILEIRRERTIEMVMEGHRQWDMFRWKEGAQIVNTPNPYYGCYIPGPGQYDMDLDGNNDLEIYLDESTTRLPNKKKIGSDIILSEGTYGYIIAWPAVTYTWNEERDYLWPIPADQRVITNGALSQNPGWEDSTNY